jgi:hypothetical protein
VENHLYLYDRTNDVYIWNMPWNTLDCNREYTGRECLKLRTACYEFYFYDEAGNGIEEGSLTLRLSGDIVLQINPGDRGTMVEIRPPVDYWYREFGLC